jgi:hypothetical protein
MISIISDFDSVYQIRRRLGYSITGHPITLGALDYCPHSRTRRESVTSSHNFDGLHRIDLRRSITGAISRPIDCQAVDHKSCSSTNSATAGAVLQVTPRNHTGCLTRIGWSVTAGGSCICQSGSSWKSEAAGSATESIRNSFAGSRKTPHICTFDNSVDWTNQVVW